MEDQNDFAVVTFGVNGDMSEEEAVDLLRLVRKLFCGNSSSYKIYWNQYCKAVRVRVLFLDDYSTSDYSCFSWIYEFLNNVTYFNVFLQEFHRCCEPVKEPDVLYFEYEWTNKKEC